METITTYGVGPDQPTYNQLREQNRVLRSNLVNCAARLGAGGVKMSNVPLFVWPVGPIINTEPIRYVVNKTDHDLVVDALREQNRVLDGALRLVLESWVNGRKVRDGIGQEVLVTVEAALTATSQEGQG